VDRQTIENYGENLVANLGNLGEQLGLGTYQPLAILRRWIEKEGSSEQRPLGIPTVRDRIAQAALRNVLEPIFERDFSEHSYGFRPGRGCKDALRRVTALLKAGYTWVVDADIKGYFDSIPHDRLMERVRTKVADGRVLKLIQDFLTQGVLDGLETLTPDEGTPQGAVISPLLANLYLDPLDHLMARLGFVMVRYADDFVILCKDEAHARQALVEVQAWMREAGLTLHPVKTRVVDVQKPGGFDFLGYHFESPNKHWPRKKSLDRFRETVRGKTGRTRGDSLAVIIKDLNQSLVGWFGYFKHSFKFTFEPLDGWIRMRLRSILRKRQGMRGRGRGRDHHRWPNAYFAKLGLFSLFKAHAELCQSLTR
jgi:RNA-directed DNA polymerase